MNCEFEAGHTYRVLYPFVLEDVELPPDDPEATQPAVVKSWRPGVVMEQEDQQSFYGAADAMGQMLLTVVDIHKPGRFPTRVFYTRQWEDPSGRVFGKGALRITTLPAFKRLMRGYRHEFWVDGEKQPNLELKGGR